MAQLPQQGSTGFTLSGFLILAALGTFIWKGAPLDSVRPNSEQSGWHEHKLAKRIPARLWQDPFKAVYAHEQAFSSGSKYRDSIETNPKSDLSKLNSKPIPSDISLLMVMLSPSSYAEIEERRRRRRYAVLSALNEEHFVPRNPEMLSVFYQPSENTNDSTDDSTDEITCKSTCESTGNKTDGIKCLPTDSNGQLKTLPKVYYSIPYEWYDYEGPPISGTETTRHVVVFWLNEDQFAASPLKHVKKLLENLLPKSLSENNTLRASLLGPARSDALRNLVNEQEDCAFLWLRDKSKLSEFNIISSTATVADADLNRNSKFLKETTTVLKETPTATDTPFPLIQRYMELPEKKREENASNAPENKGPGKNRMRFRFLRTIQSDEILIKKLTDELIHKRSIDTKKDYVVVISEWDTYFGRSLPRAFDRYFCEHGCGVNNVVRYSYQRGMDGSIAGEQNTSNQHQRSNQQKSNAGTPAIDETAMRRPVGPGQFDYLRRLASDIHNKDRAWRLSSGYGVRAVILLGSDVYDKLLILRALRPELPGVIFATTDLDAQMLHPGEFNWTRNMIIATTYDLNLSPQISMTTMPFRDSYQTSLYLATRLIFNTKIQDEVLFNQPKDDNKFILQQKFYKKIPPQLIEIGRQTLVPLVDYSKNSKYWNQVNPQPFSPAISLGLFTIALLGIFALHQLKPKAGRMVLVLIAMLLVFTIFSICIARNNIDGEPLAYFAGASIWPAEYIRILAVMLSLVFIWSVIHVLQKSWNDLGARYFWQGEETREDDLTITEIWQKLMLKLKGLSQNLKSIKCTQVIPVIMIIILILIMSIVLPIPLALFDKILLLIMVWGTLIIVWWALIYVFINKDFRVLSINKRGAPFVPDSSDAVEMWRNYGEFGATDQRFIRAIAYILIYIAFASIIFAILGSPEPPCRGEFACRLDKIVLGFSVMFMLVLLFIVVDAARLCIFWVDSMKMNKLDWSNTRKNEFIQRLKLPETHAVAWIQVHMIGERTSDVTRLIYFPVLIILLLLLARTAYFDNWDFPQALAIVIGFNFVIALGSVVRLNVVAQSARSEILRKLQYEKLANDREQNDTYEPSPSERNELIHQLESLRIGAYLRVWDQPPVRATLMLLGGVALTYAEYLSVFLR